jgi:membrane associated rhomboid family serine protease
VRLGCVFVFAVEIVAAIFAPALRVLAIFAVAGTGRAAGLTVAVLAHLAGCFVSVVFHVILPRGVYRAIAALMGSLFQELLSVS